MSQPAGHIKKCIYQTISDVVELAYDSRYQMLHAYGPLFRCMHHWCPETCSTSQKIDADFSSKRNIPGWWSTPLSDESVVHVPRVLVSR